MTGVAETAPPPKSVTGGCTCGYVRYRVSSDPLIVHACHCSRCQNQTGAPYVINALFEDDRIELDAGEVRDIRLDTPSGRGQTVSRCPKCQVAVWSRYHALPRVGDRVLFLRVGTLDEPDVFPPDVHIHTSTKLDHVLLPHDARAFERFYKVEREWSKQSMGRYAGLIA